jgi:hypothetical protein
MTGLPWFRAYARMIDDDKLRLLAFEDRWHFVALCCLKCERLLDEPDSEMKRRRIAVRLGVQVRELEEIGRRLGEVGLVDNELNPIAWDRLQFKTDKSTERVREWRKKQQKQESNKMKRCGNVSVTAQDTDTDTDTDKNNTPLPPKGVQKPDGVSDDVWMDWKRVRKKPITATVLKRMENEAAKIGWTLADAINEAAESGWQGFKADWVKERHNGRQSSSNSNTAQLALAKLGLEGG